MKPSTITESKTHAQEIEAQTGHLIKIRALRTKAKTLEEQLAPYSSHYLTDVLADLDERYDKALHLVSRAICLAMGEGEPIHEAVKQALFEWHREADGCVPRLHDALVGHYGPSTFDRLPSLIEDVLGDEDLRDTACFRRLAWLGVPIDEHGSLPLDYALIHEGGWELLGGLSREVQSSCHDWIAMWLARRMRTARVFKEDGLAAGLLKVLSDGISSADLMVDLAAQGIETSTPDGVEVRFVDIPHWSLKRRIGSSVWNLSDGHKVTCSVELMAGALASRLAKERIAKAKAANTIELIGQAREVR